VGLLQIRVEEPKPDGKTNNIAQKWQPRKVPYIFFNPKRIVNADTNFLQRIPGSMVKVVVSVLRAGVRATVVIIGGNIPRKRKLSDPPRIDRWRRHGRVVWVQWKELFSTMLMLPIIATRQLLLNVVEAASTTVRLRDIGKLHPMAGLDVPLKRVGK
jgi:hypothetical protein